MANNPVTRLTITAVDEASKKIEEINGSMKKLSASLGSIGSLASVAFGAATIYSMEKIAKSAIETAASFESMQVKLEAMTGHGKQTLEELQAWAMKMPVSTKQAVDAFTLMQAMGLNPTIDKLQILTDVSSLLGADVMPRLALVMGQMSAAGKLNAQDLNQFAAAGVNVKQILADAFGGKTVEQIQKAGISMQEILKAIWAGMDKEFGGAALAMQDTWAGVTNRMEDHFEMFKKSVMDSGPFEAVKTYIIEVINKVDELKTSGQLDQYAKDVGATIVEVIANVVQATGWLPTAFNSVDEAVKKTTAYIVAMGQAAINTSAFVLAAVNPMNAYDVATKGYRETFPMMKEAYDSLQKIGEELYQSGEDASKSAQKWAVFGNRVEEIADKIRGMALSGANKNLFSSIAEVYKAGEMESKPMAPEEDTKGAKQAIKTAQEYAKQQLDELKDAYNSLTMAKADYARYQIDVWAKEKAEVVGNIPLLQEVVRLKKQELDVEKQMAEWGDKLSIRTPADQAADDFAESQKRYDIAKEVSDKINQLSLSEHDYRVKLLDDEIKGMWAGMGGDAASMSSIGMITKYRALSMEKINEDSFNKLTTLSENTARQMERNFSSFFFDTVTGKISTFQSLAENVFNSIAKAWSDMMGQMAAQAIFGKEMSAGGGLFGALLDGVMGMFAPVSYAKHHAGGVIGVDAPSGYASLSPMVFMNAPRLHTGLASDEFPAILQKGETVIPKGGAAAGGVAVNVHNYGPQQMNAKPKISYNAQGMVVDLFIDAMNRNVGNIRSVFGG